MQYKELYGFNFVLMLMCCHDPSMQPICYFASKTWDLCNASGIKKIRAWHSEKKAGTFLAGEEALVLAYSDHVDIASGDVIWKRPTYFTLVSLLGKPELRPLLGNLLTSHFLQSSIPFLQEIGEHIFPFPDFLKLPTWVTVVRKKVTNPLTWF